MLKPHILISHIFLFIYFYFDIIECCVILSANTFIWIEWQRFRINTAAFKFKSDKEGVFQSGNIADTKERVFQLNVRLFGLRHIHVSWVQQELRSTVTLTLLRHSINTQRRFISRVVCVCNMGRRNRNRQKPQQFRDGKPEAKRSRDDAVSLLTSLASHFSAQCQCCTFIYTFNICYIVNTHII